MGKGLKSLQKKDYGRAVQRIERAAGIYDKLNEFFSTWSYLGESYLGAGQPEKALRCLQQAHSQALEERVATMSPFLRKRFQRNAGIFCGLLRRTGEEGRADEIKAEAEVALQLDPSGHRESRDNST